MTHSYRSLLVGTVLTVALPALALACDDPNCPAKLMQQADGTVTMDHAAMGHDHATHGHGAHDGHGAAAQAQALNEATRELEQAMAAMHKAMMVPYTQDPDIDFLRGMIPHHQGAVDMAKIVLKYGKDPQVRRLAREIIRTQEQEIAFMERWATQLEERAKGPGGNQGWLGESLTTY